MVNDLPFPLSSYLLRVDLNLYRRSGGGGITTKVKDKVKIGFIVSVTFRGPAASHYLGCRLVIIIYH